MVELPGKLRSLHLEYGPGGLVRVRIADDEEDDYKRPPTIAAQRRDGDPDLLVRFADAGGRLQIVELWFKGGDRAVTLATLRALPLVQLERLFNEPSEARQIRKFLAEDSPQVEPLVEQMPVHMGVRRGLPDSLRGTHRVRLAMPEVVDDEFLIELARAYHAHVAAGRPPAPAIAEEVGGAVSVRTVHGWVRKARERGYLAPGRRGAAG